ncbi:MAG: T9SS type A sorting domain-containing protein, partial [Candidatus Aegiribacteria sp.]|nr:T9SS type A sorting domain-containing protein [Candidatus Aegiribacteria sp.]
STWTNYYLDNSSLIDDDGLQVFVDNADIVWIGTEEGISKFDYPSSWTSYHTGNSGLIENHVQAIAFDESDGKWIATMGGVSHFSGTTWTNYTTADGLPNNYVTDICVSDSGIVWVSTLDGVASFEDGTGWTSWTQTEGLADNEVNTVGMGDGEVVWFGTDDSGLSSYDTSVTGVDSRGSAEIGNVLQCHASPNPFYSSVLIHFNVPVEENVNVIVFDMSGRTVRTLANETHSAQQHSVIWDGNDERGVPVSRGMYMYRVECGSSIATGKLILLN